MIPFIFGLALDQAAASQPADSTPVTTAADATPAPTRDSPHFRFGLGLDGNSMFSEGLAGLGVGLQLRLGAQVNQWFALYYQAHGIAQVP